VGNEIKLQERVKYIHEKFKVDAIAEEFISGREFFVGLIGNQKVDVLPPWEFLINGKNPPKGIITKRAKLSEYKEREIKKICRDTFNILQLNGYARIDLRMDDKGKIWVIEANPNPDIAFDDEFAASAKYLGIDYPVLLKRIIDLGLKWHELKMVA
jgi:D-alanine-D-alanine ligase